MESKLGYVEGDHTKGFKGRGMSIRAETKLNDDEHAGKDQGSNTNAEPSVVIENIEKDPDVDLLAPFRIVHETSGITVKERRGILYRC